MGRVTGDDRLPVVAHTFFGDRSERAYAIQAHLATLGFDPGTIDGMWGARSQAAFDAYSRSVKQARSASSAPVSHDPKLLSTMQAVNLFGLPGGGVQKRLVYVDLPYAMHLEWQPATVVRRIQVHELVANRMLRALEGIRDAYSATQIVTLGLDQFSGVYNHRKVTGGTTWSKHAFGIAIDLLASRNGYSTPWAKAAFARPEYDALHAAFEAQGFVNIGKVIGKDAMHFEITSDGAYAASRTLSGD